MRIVFFDGHCQLCNAAVDFLLRRDTHGFFKMAPLQGPTARELLGPGAPALDSIVYLRDKKTWQRSDAVIQILCDLGGVWKLAGALWIVPRPLRDVLYRGIARVRYRVFGRREICRAPTPAERARFLP